MTPLMEIARKEARMLVRTKRMWIVGGLLLAAMLLLTVVVPGVLLRTEIGQLFGGAGAPVHNLSMLFFLSGFFLLSGFFFIQLLPILLTADSVCGEWDRKTLFLLLSKPVSRFDMVMGKFLGIGGTVAVAVTVVLLVDYFVFMVPIIPGVPSGEEISAFIGALVIIFLGVLAFSAMSMFFSTITRSTLVSLLLSISMWIIVFPILGRLDFMIALMRHGGSAFLDPEAAGIGWSGYLSPGTSMGYSAQLLVPSSIRDDPEMNFFTGLAGTSGEPWIGAIALAIHTIAFLGFSLLVVKNRNYE